MLDRNEFGLGEKGRERRPAACIAWAELLPDAAEGLLNETEAKALDMHVASCASCAQELADARRGVAWLGLLKDHTPEPPAALLGSILAKTTGAEGATLHPAAGAIAATPVGVGVALPPGAVLGSASALGGFSLARTRFGRWLGLDKVYVPALQPRLTMTAAMAFFSICLTLNLVGLSAQSVHAQTLRPGGLQRVVAGKSASLLRSLQGFRAVYRMETRVNEWLTASAQDQQPANSGR